MDEQQRQLMEELLSSQKSREEERGFAKGLFFGRFEATSILPFPSVSSEEKKMTEELVQQVTAFAQKEIDPVWIDRHATIPDAVILGLGQLGVFGITVPKEWGGLGLSQYAFCQVTAAVARRCGSTALFINVQQSIGLKALLLFGTETQKEIWLRGLVTGEKLAAFSLTEPNAGSDASGIETRAVFDQQKGVYRINGRKQWTTSGSIADVLTVMAKTEDNKITAFLVPANSPGFKVTAAALDKVGTRGTRTANLEFSDLEVPAQNVLGKVGGGLKVALTLLDFGRTTFGAMCMGAAQELVARATQHAIERYQFKRPLASFGMVKKKIATMSALLYALEATTDLTAGLIDAGSEEIMLESAMLKVFASDSLWLIVYETMQILGGRSFFTDAPYERMMRDARLNMIGEGSNEVLRVFIGAVGMREVGLELKNLSEAWKTPWSHWSLIKHLTGKKLEQFLLPNVPVRAKELQPVAWQLEKAIRRFGLAILRLLITYREEIVEKQLLLDRIATAGIALYTATATISRLDRSLTEGANSLQKEKALARVYCNYAFQEIKKNLGSLFHHQDEQLEQLSDTITDLDKVWRKR